MKERRWPGWAQHWHLLRPGGRLVLPDALPCPILLSLLLVCASCKVPRHGGVFHAISSRLRHFFEALSAHLTMQVRSGCVSVRVCSQAGVCCRCRGSRTLLVVQAAVASPPCPAGPPHAGAMEAWVSR